MIKPNSVANDLYGEAVARTDAVTHRETPGKIPKLHGLYQFDNAHQKCSLCFSDNEFSFKGNAMTCKTFFSVLVLSSLTASCATTKSGQNISEFPLTSLDKLTPHRAEVKVSEWKNKKSVAVELTSEEQNNVLTTGGSVPAIVVIPETFTNGSIEVDVAAEINGKGSPDSRGFVGIAFHVSSDNQSMEAVYLRMTNGTLNSPLPEAPRNTRAVQYIAHPGFHFDVSRESSPGVYEKGAHIALGNWHKLRIEVDGPKAIVYVDKKEVLKVNDLKFANRAGNVALFIEDGTRGYYSNLRIEKK